MERKKILSLFCGALLGGLSLTASAGPIIIAGTDADDHGSANATTNFTGWLFMQKAFENLAPAVTNGDLTVTCIGCNSSSALSAFNSATTKSSLDGTWNFVALSTLSDITNFFNGSGTTNVNNTGIIYMPTVSSNVGGGITDAQLGIVNSNSTVLNNFVVGGGGLFTQEQANSSIGYGWLSALLPGLTVQGDNGGPGFNSSSLSITAAGNSAFPGLTNSDVTNATPWHAWFSGNFGGLNPLVNGPIFGPTGGTFPGAVVIGGGAGTVFQCGEPGQPPCDPGQVPEPGVLPLVAIGLFGLAYTVRRRYS
ncbi:PEP-CTERM sorting domain-containing protein [Nitrosovibrio tenuis]|uniref:PEP-CTERM protein-sorting domain-containing protein n=1 Tax=Nitrosovibrio tenuis TaxID=1233 RepID=A0A1H7J0C8_9PROT|nr:PEP-CTERM sorting domain-containing protein [Nitrosovibrio tenuis]SEK67662.1 PEP-CTERM protein-sorting domain-containing protein [Nitrosovibrio tenuis]